MIVANRFAVRTALWPVEVAFRDDRLARWRREPWLCEAMAPASASVPAGDGPRRGGASDFALLKELLRSVLRWSPGDYRSALGEGIWGMPHDLSPGVVRILHVDPRLHGAIARGAPAWRAALADRLAAQPAHADPTYVISTLELLAQAPCELSAWSALRARFTRVAPLAVDPAWIPRVAEAARLLAHLRPDARYLARRLDELGDAPRWELTAADRAALCAPTPQAAGDTVLACALARDRLIADALGDRRWSWDNLGERAHLPRVGCGDVVLAPETWRLATPTRDLATWRARHALPRFIEIANLDLPLPLDLDDPETPAILRELAPKRPHLAIRELLPAPADHGVRTCEGPLAHALWVPVHVGSRTLEG